jgi:hypothetical protein
MLPALRRALGLVLLVPAVALASPDRALDLDDVLRLHFAGVSDDIIISEVIVTDSVFPLSVDDILRLKEAGASERLIQFLVDTGRAGGSAGGEVAATAADDVLYADETTYDEEWVNEIVELEPTTTYHVSLNYSYPTWWYDCYWYDYWYWDFHYYPYSCSYVTHLGAWYPGWYGYRTCWTPAYWGYRSWWYDRWDYPWYAGARYSSANDRFYYAGYRDVGPRNRGLSATKTKSNGSSGLPLFADVGLKVPDGGKLQVRDAKAPRDVRDKSRDGRLAVSDRPDRTDGKTPVRGPSDSVKLPDAAGGRKPVLPDRSLGGTPDPVRTPALPTPVRDVRSPAGGGRPVKVRTLSDPSGEVPEPPSRGDTPTPPPTRPTPAPKTPAVAPSTPAPAPKVSPPPRPAPTPKASPPPRTSPPPKASPPPKSSPSPGRSKASPPPRPKGGRR